ncbi:hypothetical protein VFPPC_09322 [Pochonia chlamydosporia 170]|uniref:Integral membrane protein n=1 Tax=Pochonia chlamydosporia 170 TaxID=1380566 RepID=A0A179F8K2_METCM|nr:hypothetical protein VFPPC_09322 [Pochonia chlamydosporia 170]OAQ61493.1 hypothetical protein VFPPC_09322 [Pochonia chlamydosporia 170]
MADKVASYHDDPDRLALAQQMEDNKTHAVKSKFDYAILMDECTKSGAPYMLLVEDDVVFLHGWRHRTMKALGIASVESWGAAHTDFLYLRLFHHEGLRGWNVESWRRYLGWSVVSTTSSLCALFLARRFVTSARRHLTRSVVLLVPFVFTPLLIILYFAAGANCVQPQPEGVHLMPKNACCGQALVFPQTTVTKELLPLFEKNRWSESPTDSFIEDYANAKGGLRWGLTPVVVQHVGSTSTYNTDERLYGNMTPSDIWNYKFEENAPSSLAEEHLRLYGPVMTND